MGTMGRVHREPKVVHVMSGKISLLQIKTITYKDEDHLKEMIKFHQRKLKQISENLDSPSALAALQAVAYNLIHLARELKKPKGKANLVVFPGKKD